MAALPDPKVMPPDLPWTAGLGAADPENIPNLNIEIDGDGNVFYGSAPEQANPETPKRPSRFDDNLADGANLAGLASDLIEGIESDDKSREGWIANYNAGMELLATRLEDVASSAAMGGGKSVSRVRHPLLLWAVVKSQSMARAEMLPAAGPVKVMTIGKTDEATRERADALESDLNAYLTVGAPEYYPDMDRGLFLLFYGGVIFKKIYRCPWRDRPVSEVVSVPDLIVSQEATDLDNAVRVTHRITMPPSLMAKFLEDGVYSDIPVGEPAGQPTSTDQKIAAQSGIAATTDRPKDKPHTIYECYTDLDLSVYGIKQPVKRPLPYRISIERDARQILEIRRNWKDGDKNYRRRKRFVKFGLIPGFGFLDYGYLHLLGNHTRALTALWRLVIDAGMFANFPGGLRVRGPRSDTNEFSPAPGEFVPIDTGGLQDIRSAIMPMPYKDPSVVMLNMIQQLAGDGQQLAGTADVEVGEGRANVPVGTVMAMVEQQTQVMAACHKRLHASQQEEFLVLKDLLQEDPGALVRHNPNPVREWQASAELDDLDLVPASDPNIPSRTHRLQQWYGLMQMAQAGGPALFNLQEVAKEGIDTLGYSDGERFLANPAQAGQAMGQQQGGAAPAIPSGKSPQEIAADQQSKAQELAAKMQDNAANRQLDGMELKTKVEQQVLDRQSKENIARENNQVRLEEIAADERRHQNELAQRASESALEPPEPTE